MSARYQQTSLPGVMLIEPQVFVDERGDFFESYHERQAARAGISVRFVQDNQSRSRQNVLRGLHSQRALAKLVRVVHGEVFDVAVDMRPDSPEYLKWFGITLSAENRLQMFIPAGFAHGFYTLSPEAVFCYKCSDYYKPALESGVRYDDPALGIEWPLLGKPLLSARDAAFPLLRGDAI